MIRKVHLHGHLGATYGDGFELEVETAGEAIRALNANFPAFMKTLGEGSYQIIRGDVETGYGLELDDINAYRLGRADLHIVPVVEGSKSGGGGTAKILIGLAIVGAAVFFAPAVGGLGASVMGGGLLGGITYGNIALIGAAIALAGVSSMLAPAEEKEEKTTESHTLTGPSNVYEQGNPVPLVYGETITGGVLVSVSMDIEDIGKFKSGNGNGSGN